MSRLNLSRRKSTQAVALLTAMIVCFFLLVLTGALVQTQSGAFAVAQSSDSRVRARAACQSLYDYCLYQLEHNRDWGKNGFPSLVAVDPPRTDNSAGADLALRVEVEEIGRDNRLFLGYLSEHNAGFEVAVVNALTSPSGATSSDGLSALHQQVRLRITTWEGRDPKTSQGARQQVDCLLRLAPLYDGSVLSRGDLTVQADEVLFASKDPFRNEIRAQGDVELPGLTHGRTRFVQHNQEVIREGSPLNKLIYDNTGMLWSGANISQETGQIDTPTEYQEAGQKTGGRIVDQAVNRADIYDLKPENIPQPTFPPERDIRTPPGEFRFTKAMATVRYQQKIQDNGGGHHWESRERSEPLDVLEYYDPPNSPDPLKVLRRAPEPLDDDDQRFVGIDIKYGSGLGADVPVVIGDKFYVNDEEFQSSVDVQDINGNTIAVPELGFRKAESGGFGPVAIDLRNQTVVVEPDTRMRPTSRPEGSSDPPSAFELTVKSGPGGAPGLPTFKLGSGSNDVVIEADGDVAIGAGYTRGLGTIISKQGNVILNPLTQELNWVQKYIDGVPTWILEREMTLETNAKYAGLVVYAEKDVRIGNISDADWAVRGFIYARRNFLFDVGGENATFYGSVVAGNSPTEPGQFQISNGKRATFIYDPEYLKLLTEQLPYNWTRLEPVVWSEGNG